MADDTDSDTFPLQTNCLFDFSYPYLVFGTSFLPCNWWYHFRGLGSWVFVVTCQHCGARILIAFQPRRQVSFSVQTMGRFQCWFEDGLRAWNTCCCRLIAFHILQLSFLCVSLPPSPFFLVRLYIAFLIVFTFSAARKSPTAGTKYAAITFFW